MLKLWIRGAKRELLTFRFTMKPLGQGLLKPNVHACQQHSPIFKTRHLVAGTIPSDGIYNNPCACHENKTLGEKKRGPQVTLRM